MALKGILGAGDIVHRCAWSLQALESSLEVTGVQLWSPSEGKGPNVWMEDKDHGNTGETGATYEPIAP